MPRISTAGSVAQRDVGRAGRSSASDRSRWARFHSASVCSQFGFNLQQVGLGTFERRLRLIALGDVDCIVDDGQNRAFLYFGEP